MTLPLDLAGELRAAQDATLRGANGYPEVRRRVMIATPARRSPRVRKASVLVACALAAAVLSLVLRPRPLELSAGGNTLSGAVDLSFSVPDSQELTLAFSDGSAMVIGSASRLHVERVERGAVDLALREGTLRAEIRSGTSTRWRIEAGPLRVLVTGTRFSMEWRAREERLSVTVDQGGVRVGAPGAEERLVVGGQSLVIDCGRTPSACGRMALSLPLPAPTEPAGPDASPPDPSPASTRAAAKPGAPASVPDATWQQLAAQGKWREALKRVEDVDQLLATGNADELMQFANVALYSGQGGLASRALGMVRARFPGSPRAAEAAFRLGRMAFDGAGSYSAAATWFDTYLREQPGGAFAREASGRLIECHQRQGAAAAARQQAERYLKAYPGGPHAALARSLVGD